MHYIDTAVQDALASPHSVAPLYTLPARTFESHLREMVGYSHYEAGHPISVCVDEEQRRGYRLAQLGEMHSDNCDAAIAGGMAAGCVDAWAERMTMQDWGTYQEYMEQKDDNWDINDEAADAYQFGWQG